MPWSCVKTAGHWIEVRDNRLEDIIDLCGKLLPSFLESQPNAGQLHWLQDLVRDWTEQRELAPGCKSLRPDEWLSSEERRETLGAFLQFVAKTIATTLPATERILAKDCARIRDLVLKRAQGTARPTFCMRRRIIFITAVVFVVAVLAIVLWPRPKHLQPTPFLLED